MELCEKKSSIIEAHSRGTCFTYMRFLADGEILYIASSQ